MDSKKISERLETARAGLAELERQREAALDAAAEAELSGKGADAKGLARIAGEIEDRRSIIERLELKFTEAQKAEAHEARGQLIDQVARNVETGVREAIRGMEAAIKSVVAIQGIRDTLAASRDAWRTIVRRLPGDHLTTTPGYLFTVDGLPSSAEMDELAGRLERRLEELRAFDSKEYRDSLESAVDEALNPATVHESEPSQSVDLNDPERVRRTEEYRARFTKIRERPCLTVGLPDEAATRARNAEIRKEYDEEQARDIAALKAEYPDLFPESV